MDLASVVISRRGYVVIEWPLSCRYWKDAAVINLLSIPIWHETVFNGCAFGLRLTTGIHAGKYMAKPWKIMSTISALTACVGRKCPGGPGHVHVKTQGSYTPKSARYPQELSDESVRGVLIICISRHKDHTLQNLLVTHSNCLMSYISVSQSFH